jgi:hypothetical protein
MDRLTALIRSLPSTLLLAALVALCAFGWMRACNQASRARADVERTRQEGTLAAAGIATAAEVDRRALAGRLEAAERYVAGLEAQVRRAQVAVPGLKPVAVVIGSTGPVQVGGASSGAAPEPGEGPPTPPVAASPGRECLLEPGDQGEIRVSGAALESRAGAVAVVGAAEAWRLRPDRLLFGGPLHLEVSTEARARAPGWAYGLGGGISDRGALGAVLVQTPPATIPLVHWPARAWFLAAGGTSQGLILGGVNVEP